MAASIHEGEETTSDKSTPFQINTSPSSASGQSAFPHTVIPWEKCISWSLVPMPALPVQPRPQSAPQFTAQMCNINLSRVTTLPATVPIPVRRPDFHDSSAKSIPVSVIKRVVPTPTDKDLRASHNSVGNIWVSQYRVTSRGVLPYVSYTGMCCCEGSGYLVV